MHAAAGATISTVAGGGSAAGDGVPALSVALASPIGVAPTANGFVLAEQARHRIRRVTAGGAPPGDTGLIATHVGTGAFGGGSPVLGGSATSVPLQLPCCLAPTAAGGLLVADTFGGMVHRVSGSRLDTVAGTGTPSSCNPVAPSGVAALSAQLCFVVGVGAHPSEARFLIAEDGLPDQERSGGARVYEVDPGGTLRIVAGGGCPASPPDPNPLQLCLANPRGAVYTGAGTQFLVADRARHVVWRVSSTSGAGATAVRVAGTGSPAGELGDGGRAGAASLAAPADLAVTPSGGFLIADRDHCRVRRVAGVDPSSRIETVAGSGCAADAPALDGGEATAANLRRPLGVAFSPAGILVSDTGRGTVRLVERTTLTRAPVEVTPEQDASFAFESSESVADFRCALDGEPARPCSSPAEFGGLADGPHRFAVHDAAVPADPTPAVHSWLVDTEPPRPFGLMGPADGAGDEPSRPVFEWEEAVDATSGVAVYELWLDGRRWQDVAPAACERGVCRFVPHEPLPESAHEWRVLARDRAGHARGAGPRVVHVGSPPTARLVVAPDPVLTGYEAVFDASASSDPDGPIVRYEWDLDGDGEFERDSGAQPMTTMSYPLPGRVRVGLRVTDAAGRTGATAAELRVTEPPSGPRAFGVTIDSGASFTRTPAVTISAFHSESTDAVIVSNDGGFLVAATFPAGEPIRWRLASTGPERLPRTVYVRFRSGPFLSEVYTDDIVLDESPPRVAAARLSSSVLRTTAADRGSGVSRMQVTPERRRPGRAQRYRPALRLDTRPRRLWVRVFDRAGNRSAWRAARYSGPR